MKIKFILLSFVLLLFSCFNSQTIVFAESAPLWCRITKEGTHLFSDSNLTNEMFFLPTSYFAYILSYDENTLKVKFSDAVGYVKKEDVTIVYSEPLMPFPEDATCEINSSVFAVIKDAPNTSANTVESIPNNTTVNFLGKTTGQEAISNLGNEWFYVKYNKDNQNYFGYIYAPLTQNLTEIPQNDEEVLLTPVIAKNQNFSLSPELYSGKNILIIACLFFAGILLMLSIVVPMRKKKQTRRIVVPPKANDLDF